MKNTRTGARVPLVVRWRKYLMESGVNRTDMLAGFVLAEHADYATGRGARPSLDRMSTLMGGLARDNVGKALARLARAGLVVRTRRGAPGKPSEWALVLPGEEPEHPTSASDDASEHPTCTSDDGATPDATPDAHVGLPVTKGEGEEDAGARDLLDGLASLMADVDEKQADAARRSQPAMAAARQAADAGRTVEDVQRAFTERAVGEIHSGPGLACTLLGRVRDGHDLTRPRTRRTGAVPSSPAAFGPTSQEAFRW